MLGYVATLWLVGVVCLVASVVGSSVKLVGSEIPAIPSPTARLGIAFIGVVALALGLVLLRWDSPTSGSPDSSATRPGAPPPNHSSGAPQATSTDSPTSDPSTSTSSTPRAVRVWWHGTLVLGGHGGPGGGWFLDAAPPTPAVAGDLYFGNANEIAGDAIVAWDGPGPPKQQQCSDLLSTQLGQRVLDVQVDSVACFKTEGGRIGYLMVDRTPDPNELTPSMTVQATVWERR